MVDDNEPFLIISARVRQKLAQKHSVALSEVNQCFLNYTENRFLDDPREEHKTDPSTKWFIGETDSGRLLKVCFIYFESLEKVVIKTAFEPNQIELDMFFRNDS